MQTSTIRHNITAQNVANINTPAYDAYVPSQTDLMPEGTRIASVSRIPGSNPQLSGTDLVEETKNQLVDKGTFKANAAVFKAKDKMLGELLDMMG